MRDSHPLSKHYRAFYIASVALAAIGGAWVYVVINFEGQPLAGCPSKLLYHIPCPGCGMTRAAISLLHGNLVSAIRYNPNIAIVAPVFLVEMFCVLTDIVFSKLYAYKLFHQIDKTLKIPIVFCGLIVFEIFVWLHNIIAGI